jgi:hypothetical protein
MDGATVATDPRIVVSGRDSTRRTAAEPGSVDGDRSGGGLSTKIDQLVDGHGRPLVIALTAGQGL